MAVKAALTHPDRLTAPKPSRASACAFVVRLFKSEPAEMHTKRRVFHSEFRDPVIGNASQRLATRSATTLADLQKAIQYP